MKVQLTPDFPVTDSACRKATQHTLAQWYQLLDERDDINRKRRDAINWMYEQMNKDPWWPATVWVEYERYHGIVNRKDGRSEGFNICVTKTIAASIPVVFAAWTDLQSLQNWFGSETQAEVREVGSFDDGDGHSGQFSRVRRDKDLRFSWLDSESQCPTLVDVAFADKGKGRTGITLNHQRIQTRAEADGLRRAWGEALDRLKELLEK